jgi:hypothetical protein
MRMVQQVPEGHTRLTFNLDKKLLKKLKQAALDEDRSVTKLLIEMITAYVEGRSAKRRKKE